MTIHTAGLRPALLATCAFGALWGQTALAQTTPAAPEVDTAAQGGVADIVVTANRRAERNQDVPIAITAFSADRLDKQNITTSQDLQGTVPSLVVGANGQGSRDTQSFTLRGQGATFQASPGVVVYMNEVPLPAPITLSQQGGPGNYADLENVQVLAGPQGTLFGRNTTGGAVLLVPHKPVAELGASLTAKLGNYNNREFEGMINVPIIGDKLMIRAVGTYHDRDGYTHDVVFNKDRDNVHNYSGRLGIMFRPSDRFENYLMAYGAYSSNNGTGMIHRGFNLDGLRAFQFCTNPACTPYSTATAIADALGPRRMAPDVDEVQTTKTWGIINTTSFEVNDTTKIRNIFSYQNFWSYYLVDGDGTIFQQYDTGVAKLPTGPVTVTAGGLSIGPYTYHNATPQGPRDDLAVYTEELQLQGSLLDKQLTYTIGGFYFDQHPDGPTNGFQISYCPAASTGFCPTSAPGGGSGVTNKSKALYAQATLDMGALSPSLAGLRLTGGYRYTWDHIYGFSRSGSFGTKANAGKIVCSSDGRVVATVADCTFTGDLHSSAPNWLVGLDYKAGNVLFFGKVSHGYKAGGFNPQAVRVNTRTFDPETVTSYELGFKSDWRFGTVPFRLNASAYHVDYSNIQRATGDTNPDTKKSGAAIRSASAWIEGLEVEAAMKPFPGLEIGGNFSYTDAHYKKYQYVVNTPTVGCNGLTVPTGGTVDVTCKPFNYIAPYLWSIHATATVPLARDLGEVSLFVNYSHSSSQHTDGSILPQYQPGELLPAFGLLNASLDWNNIAGSGMDAGLYVTNATNKLYAISNTNVYQVGSGLLSWAQIYGEPRMYGIKLRYRFGAR
jgi:iron complex outermembrane receptor protein